MPRLLPPTFQIEPLEPCLPFILQAEVSTAPLRAACCLFDPSAFTPQLISQFGLVLPEALRHAVKKRQAEYVASRWLVAKLLETIDIPSFQLFNRPDRSPIWPTGKVGSLSHHDHKTFALIDSYPTWVGNDIERMLTQQKAAELRSMIMTHEELSLLTSAGFSLSQATTLVFSVKETVYKAVYPEVQTVFGFEQVTITACDPHLGRVTAHLSAVAQPISSPHPQWDIHYWLTDTEVMSWVARKTL
ncbi:4'-phosphopantetheinyl transferase family protein [Rosenbergiella nectarea]|uniref:4'-phosphopantetheinyl transferase family protein n=1 Tax=Rosenbergiella nectarea TaxID=988801 RepID=UPI001F4D4C66|nr:4'-phosphopantetheinyl transferase superfamily protein [Rosenbergiella nectarea]